VDLSWLGELTKPFSNLRSPIAERILSGGVKIGASVGQTLLAEYLKQYCGFELMEDD
jgi:hypothetical protein